MSPALAKIETIITRRETGRFSKFNSKDPKSYSDNYTNVKRVSTTRYYNILTWYFCWFLASAEDELHPPRLHALSAI